MDTILLVQPRSTTYQARTVAESLGLGYLAAMLRQEGLGVEILDGVVARLGVRQLADQIVERKPALVGISVHGQVLAKSVRDIAKIVRDRGCQAHICLGGIFPSIEHECVLGWPHIDSVVRKEGEYTFTQLALCVLNGLPLADVKGVTYRSPEGEVIVNPAREWILDIDVLPFPSRDTLPAVLKVSQSAQILAGRGCLYGRCAFCSTAAFYGRGHKVVRSPTAVVEELASLVKDYDCRFFRFSDDSFVDRSDASLRWVETFCEEISKRKLRISFRVNMRADCVSRKVMMNLKRAGLWEVSFGIEGGAQCILDSYCKGTNVSDNTRAIAILEELGIRSKPTFILFDPYVRWSDLKSTIRCMNNIRVHSLKGFYRKVIPYAGTAIRARMVNDGLLQAKDFDDLASYEFQDSRVSQLYSLVKSVESGLALLNSYMSEFKNRWIWLLDEFERVFERVPNSSLQVLLEDLERYDQIVESRVSGLISKLVELVERGQVDASMDVFPGYAFKKCVEELGDEAESIWARAVQLVDSPPNAEVNEN